MSHDPVISQGVAATPAMGKCEYSEAPPVLSIVVPVYRDWMRFADLMDCIEAQHGAPPPFEVIAVNNDPERAPALEGRETVRIVDCVQPGSYPARNAGAAVAQGDWLVFTDADCLPEAGWLANLLTAIGDRHADLLAGPVDVFAGACPNRWEIYDVLRGIPQARYVDHGYAATANLAVRADLFRKLGGFDPARRSGGDADFCRRARAGGARLVLVKNARVRHPARNSRDDTMDKARRIKGGQIGAGTARRRAYWLARTLVPPVHEMARYLVAPQPLRYRFTALAVRAEIWGVELAEAVRLIAGGAPQRR
ncbi:MAG: glycosyltransferase [Pseudomonadota bacterium]